MAHNPKANTRESRREEGAIHELALTSEELRQLSELCEHAEHTAMEHANAAEHAQLWHECNPQISLVLNYRRLQAKITEVLIARGEAPGPKQLH